MLDIAVPDVTTDQRLSPKSYPYGPKFRHLKPHIVRFHRFK